MINPSAGAPLFDEPAVRALDRAAIEGGIPGLELMIRAGTACLRELVREWPGLQRIAVVCGNGNNGGDGYVVARLAAAAGHAVRVIQIGEPAKLGADARSCRDAMIAGGIEPESTPDAVDWADVIVDALFGIGLTRPAEGEYASIITRMNAARASIVSVDVPSGIEATRGRRLGIAVEASLTVTFIGAKQGLYTADGPAYCGRVVCDSLAVPQTVYESVPATASLLAADRLHGRFQPRRRTAHKGDNGHVLLIGGAPGYTGAIRLAGEAAARVGAGLVTIATHPDGIVGANSGRPELMVHPVNGRDELLPLLRGASIVAIGPGLGRSPWAAAMLGAVLEHETPLVADADALNLLARDPLPLPRAVLTPHPGEAARLLDCSTADIHADRFAAAAGLYERFCAVAVLKGAGTIVHDGGTPCVIAAGNPGMGGGGMGDVLTGVIAGLAAQGASLADAARYGACVHAVAGDRAAGAGERGLLAADLMPHLRALVN